MSSVEREAEPALVRSRVSNDSVLTETPQANLFKNSKTIKFMTACLCSQNIGV